MTAAVRKGDVCTGHGCWPSRNNDQASESVFVDSLGQHRLTDHWSSHCCPKEGCHDSAASSGSDSVFANGLAKCRIGDAVACGSTMATGSSSYYIGR